DEARCPVDAVLIARSAGRQNSLTSSSLVAEVPPYEACDVRVWRLGAGQTLGFGPTTVGGGVDVHDGSIHVEHVVDRSGDSVPIHPVEGLREDGGAKLTGPGRALSGG